MNDLTKKSVEELKKLEEESRAELFALRFQSAMGNLEKPHRIGELKKQIARILTILYARKNTGENTVINVKINLNETYTKIEKESQAFSKQRKAKIEQMMIEQQAAGGEMQSLMDLQLNDAMDLTEESVVLTTGEANVIDEQKIPVAVKKPLAKSKTTPSNETTVIVKSATSTKTDIEVSKETKKAEPTKTTKKTTELNAKEKLATIKNFVVMGSTAKECGSGVEIDLELKSKDPNTKEYTYGINWKENRDKILTAGKTIKKPMTKQLRKGQGKNNGKK